ncbi:hypothetical protein ERJ75_000747700 [Trypanosoma vivax]|nr:hypothetical protein ERJ75_000747700 [Trypanosoma vivax]
MQGRATTRRGQVTTSPSGESHEDQQPQIVPPVLRHYVGKLKECLVDRSLTPQVCAKMLRDEEFFRYVSGLHMKAFSELVKTVAWAWWGPHMRNIANKSSGKDRVGEPDADGVETPEVGTSATAIANNQMVTETANESVREDGRSDCMGEEVCRDLHSVLLLAVVVTAPYRLVQEENTYGFTYLPRLMLCGDPSVIYLGLLINLSQTNQIERAPEGVCVLRVVANGWGSTPTFEDVVKCSLRSRQQIRGQASNRVNFRDGHNDGNAEAAASSSMSMEEEGGAKYDAAMLQFPEARKSFLQTTDTTSVNRNTNQSASSVDLQFVTRRLHEALADASGNAEKLLWWCRCRLLCLMLLPSSERDEILVGPACEFFRSACRVEQLFDDILNEAEHESEKRLSAFGTPNSSNAEIPSAADLVGAMADIVCGWHHSQRTGGTSGNLTTSCAMRNPLDTINRVLPVHRKFQQQSHSCFEDEWQYRLLVDYHSTHLVVFPPSNSTRNAALPAMVAQMTDILRQYPSYSPVEIMCSLSIAREVTNLPVALNAGLVPAIVVVIRTYLDDESDCVVSVNKDGCGFSSDEERVRWCGWSYRAVNVLCWCFTVLERLVMVSTHDSVNPIVFLLSPSETDGYELCRHISKKILRNGGPPLLMVAVFRFLAACIHHNVRDVVPALLQRGILDTLLHIVESAALLARYNDSGLGSIMTTDKEPAESPRASGEEIDAPTDVSGTHGLGAELGGIEEVSSAALDDDCVAYYEQALPVVNVCTVLQAFAVHNNTHSKLSNPRLMRYIIWSLVVPSSLKHAAGQTLTCPSTPPIHYAEELFPQRVTTRVAVAAGKDLLSLLRTLPWLQDRFFETLSDVLKSLAAEAKQRQLADNGTEQGCRGSRTSRNVALSIWNIFACITGAEFRQLSQRNSYRRVRSQQQQDVNVNSFGETMVRMLANCETVLCDALATVLRLGCPVASVNSPSIPNNCCVLSSFLFGLPPELFESASKKVVSFAKEQTAAIVSACAYPDSDGNALKEEHVASLLFLVWAFFINNQATLPPLHPITQFRRSLADAVFDAYVALETGQGNSMTHENTSSAEALAVSALPTLQPPTSLPILSSSGTGSVTLYRGIVGTPAWDIELEPVDWMIPDGAETQDAIPIFIMPNNAGTGVVGGPSTYGGILSLQQGNESPIMLWRGFVFLCHCC